MVEHWLSAVLCIAHPNHTTHHHTMLGTVEDEWDNVPHFQRPVAENTVLQYPNTDNYSVHTLQRSLAVEAPNIRRTNILTFSSCSC